MTVPPADPTAPTDETNDSPTLPDGDAGPGTEPDAAPSSPPGTGWRPTPTWYAAEIIVVVVGVIIALAANAWWEGRRAAALEAEVRQAIRVELEGNRRELQSILGATAECLDRTDRFLRRTPAALAAVPADSTLYWVRSVSCRRTFEAAFGVARALTGAAGFDSVDDLQVRAAVADWVTAVDDAAEERATLSHHGDRVYEALSRYAVAGADSGLAAFPTLPRLVARSGTAVLPALRRDTALIRATLRRAHYQRAYSQELTEALAAADSALALLAGTD